MIDRRPMSARELLATRVLPMEAYHQERRDPQRRQEAGREIPVPLWPRETLQQCERDFVRWLTERRLSLAALSKDPMTERNLRLQFAQARLSRSSPPVYTEENSRNPMAPSPRYAPPRPRSRSRSPPQSRTMAKFSREDARPKMSRRDRGLPLTPRRAGEREQRGRSQSRERSHAYEIPHEVVFRRRQVDRSPSPRHDVRQYPNNGPLSRRNDHPHPDHQLTSPRTGRPQYLDGPSRWNVSGRASRGVRPTSPRYGRSASPIPRSTSPHTQFEHPRSAPTYEPLSRSTLLAKRILTVEGFRDEMHKLSNGLVREDDLKQPGEPIVRIPVVLWPGETMAQYVQQFERWLESRRGSLASLREDPPRERSMWLSFAHTRAGTSDLRQQVLLNGGRRSPTRLRSRSRSNSRTSSRTGPRRSIERERSLSPSKIQSSKPPPFSLAPPESPQMLLQHPRWKLLERRVVSLDDFQKEMNEAPFASLSDNDVPRIPVPLSSGESMGLYDHRFWTWLKSYNESKDTLRSDPIKERAFRRTFAYLRVNKSNSTASTGGHGDQVHQAPGRIATKALTGALRSQRPRLPLSLKRQVAEDSNHSDQLQTSHIVNDTKRPRIDAEGATPELPSSRSPAIAGQSRLTMFRVAPPRQQNLSSAVPKALPSVSASSSAAPAASMTKSMDRPRPVATSQTATSASRAAIASVAAPVSSAPTTPVSDPEPAVPTSAPGPIITAPSPNAATNINKTSPATDAVESSSVLTSSAAAMVPEAVVTSTVSTTNKLTTSSPTDLEPADEPDAHDGDILNPEGCCCVTCMRSWAKTLADRMDQLEGNVLSLKRDVIDHAGGEE